jgi:hypothetical protein
MRKKFSKFCYLAETFRSRPLFPLQQEASKMTNTAKSIQMFTLLAIVVSFVSGCQKSDDTADTATDSQTDAVESAITMIAGQADDAAGSSFAVQTKSDAYKYALVESLLFGRADAANCGRAYDQSCDNATGVKTVSYSSCNISARNFSLTGSVTLTYSNNSCLLGIGDHVTRTYDTTISGPRSGAIQTTSALRTDYRGTQIGGGGRLTRAGASAWNVDLYGKHKIGTRNGRTLFDVSARTTTQMAITNSLTRSGRTVSSGVVEVNHNVAGFTATLSANASQPLVWTSLCCHPVSGRLDATYAGSITGSGSITFNGCGTAELSKDGSTRTLSLGYCE